MDKTKADAIPGVTWNDDGSADVTLKQSIRKGAETLTALRITCPSLTQVTTHMAAKGDELVQERAFLADLTGLTAEELGAIAWPDYRRVQLVFTAYMEAEAPNFRVA